MNCDNANNYNNVIYLGNKPRRDKKESEKYSWYITLTELMVQIRKKKELSRKDVIQCTLYILPPFTYFTCLKIQIKSR